MYIVICDPIQPYGMSRKSPKLVWSNWPINRRGPKEINRNVNMVFTPINILPYNNVFLSDIPTGRPKNALSSINKIEKSPNVLKTHFVGSSHIIKC